MSRDSESVSAHAQAILSDIEQRADELMAELEGTAAQAGWSVVRSSTSEEAAGYIAGLARDLEARSVMYSAHPVLAALGLENALAGSVAEVSFAAIGDADDGEERERLRLTLRERLIHADLGVTGVDYAIAETGSCVIVAGKGVSRLVSLLPPVHVAVVERGHVLPGLDELFTLRRRDTLAGNPASYMNIISGPSRSADIEQTLVTGVHGPREAHMVLVG